MKSPRRTAARRTVAFAIVIAAVGTLLSYGPSSADARPVRGRRQVCTAQTGMRARCHAEMEVVAADNPAPLVASSPYGLDPATIKSAYGFTTSLTAGAGETVAIVDAYDSPTAASDLDVFSSQYGLPCNGCLTKVNQTGGSIYPPVDNGWALEIALDVQWAHAIAPGAQILLVEARSNSFSDLMAAEDYAKTHAQYVSNSWGAPEFSSQTFYDSRFSQSGVSFFVSSGDNGLPAEYPSSSPNVISVGGTRLNGVGTTGFTETAWSSGGGGCSLYENATAAQSGFGEYAQVGCSGKRATPDVSLDADPASGVSVYTTTAATGAKGWYQVGGTSASAPMWAARAAIDGGLVNSARIYGASAPPFRDITSGSNGAPTRVGFDLATGRGSWADGAPDPTTTTTTTSTTTTTTSTTTTTTTTTLQQGVPVASFTTSCSTRTCTFTSTSTGSSLTYKWSGSSSLTGTNRTVTKTYSTGTATYTVTLTVKNPSGQSSTVTHHVSCRRASFFGTTTCTGTA